VPAAERGRWSLAARGSAGGELRLPALRSPSAAAGGPAGAWDAEPGAPEPSPSPPLPPGGPPSTPSQFSVLGCRHPGVTAASAPSLRSVRRPGSGAERCGSLPGKGACPHGSVLVLLQRGGEQRSLRGRGRGCRVLGDRAVS